MPELPGVSHRYVDAAGLRVHVAEAGDPEAPPVVMLHGWPQHWWMWRRVIPLLSDHHRLICPDLRGHGWTDAPPGGYDKEQFASDLLATLDALELDRVRLIGHDWGGWTGFLACLRAPERFERYLALSIAHPFPSRDVRSALQAWRMIYQVVLATPVVGTSLQRSPLLKRAYTGGSAADPQAWTSEDREIFAERFRDVARARAGQMVYRTFLLRELPALAAGRYRDRRLTVPGRLMVGGQEAVVHEAFTGGLDRYADDFPVEIVDGCGHFLPEERPQLVADRALELFSGA